MRKALIFILIALFLTSCTSLGSNDPFWYVVAKEKDDKAIFKTVGIGDSEESAKNDAYLNLLSDVSSYLGRDISSSYYNELVSLDEIKSLGLYIDESEYLVDSYYLVSYANSSLLLEHQSAEKKAQTALENMEEELLNKAIDKYKNLEDLNSLKIYLDLFEIAVLNEQDKLKDLCLERIDKILSLINFSSGQDIDEIKLLRKSTILPTGVVHGEIEMSYNIIKQDGSVSSINEKSNTNEDGFVNTALAYPKTLESGLVVFSLSIVEKLENMSLKYEELIPSLNLAKSKTKTVSYDLDKNKRVIVIIELLDQEFLSNQAFHDSIRSYLTSVGCEVDLNIVHHHTIIEEIESYNEYDYLILGQVALESVDGLDMISAYGESSFIDIKNEKFISNKEVVRSTSLDSSKKIEVLSSWARKTMNSFISFI